MMRIVLAIVVYLFSAAEISAQERYFLAIQSDDHQPFYVRVANKTWSSSAVGNVVVPSLGDSTYQVSVGFPRSKFPEQNFLVSFNRKDLGYTLKQGSGQEWNLVSWNSGEKLEPRAGTKAETNWYGDKKKEDAFTNLMAAVVNDSAVLYVAQVKELPGKQEVFAKAEPATEKPVDSSLTIITDTVKSVATNVSLADTLVTKTDTVQALAVNTATPATSLPKDTLTVKVDTALAVVATPREDGAGSTAGPILVYTAPKPTVSKLQDYVNGKGRTLIYADSSAAGIDTISVVIDLEPDTIKDIAIQQPVTENKATVVVDTPQKSAPVVVDTPKVVAESPVVTAVEVKDTATAGDKKKLVLINSDCVNFATDNDIDKLRVKMLDEPSIESKVAATKKLFKSKCIYTRQIRALSELFANDEGRFRFFEQCYPFTADTAEFRSLLSLLSEDAYIARFKTLVRIKD